jgi:TonB-dependent starch-binding outer membrane protein SusC
MKVKFRTNGIFSKVLLRIATCTFLMVGASLSQINAAPVNMEGTSAVANQQQSLTISGKITDENGDALPGVNIIEKGTTKGTITDLNGAYSVVVSTGSTLSFSYLGYVTQDVVIGSQTTINITLKEDVKLVDEVVIIGYGTQRKGDVTSAITSVKAEDFNQGKVGDAAELVKGKVAGLVIAKGSGDPNAESAIRLRGVISLKGNSTPLILIDGIEGGLGTVAPENIASIDVLKDASSAAIYGTRGANGVIIITTKLGKRGASTVANYSGYGSFSKFGKTLDFMDPEDIRNDFTSFNDKGHDTDWLDAITQTAFTQNHNFNISGGTDKTTYSADFTYRNEQGVIIDTFNDEMKMNFDISHWMLNDMLKVNFNLVNGWHKNSATNANNDGESNIYRQAIIRNPTEPIYREDGSYNKDFRG